MHGELLSGKGYSVGDKSANDDHQNHGKDEYAIGDALPSMHSALRARSQRGIGKETGYEE